MSEAVYLVGAGAHPWGKWPEIPQRALAEHALLAALADAGLEWRALQGLVAASSRFEGGLGWGLHANELAQALGETGLAPVNVGGGCAAGAIAVHAAVGMIASGQAEAVGVVGAEKMPRGFIPRPPGQPDDITDTDYLRWVAVGATNPAYWALEARRRMIEHGTAPETFALASVLMRSHGAANPRARYRDPLEVADVLASPTVADPLHLMEICAVSDGAAALVLAGEDLARRLPGPRVRVAGSAIAGGRFGDPAARIPTVAVPSGGGAPHTSEVVGAVRGAQRAAGISHDDVDVLELADNSAWHVLAWPEALGFVPAGGADAMLHDGAFGLEGPLPLNPSGGFLSFGEATTAQGVLQICELAWQLRGEAEGRQVSGARVGQTAVLGLGANGASVVLRSEG